MVDNQQLFTMFDALGIVTTTVVHPPLRTLEDSRRWRSGLQGAHAKNLFLKDKKGGYWLLTALEDTQVDLRIAASLLQAPRFSFAKAEELDRYLGIVPGAVSPLAAVNDASGQVCVVLERRVTELSLLNCHPLRNDQTTTIAVADLLKFLQTINHQPRIIDLPG
jgi:Ala-tRNA(Pro) deacylase